MMLDKGEGEKTGVGVVIGGEDLSYNDRRLTKMNSPEDLFGPATIETGQYAWEQTKFYGGIIWDHLKERLPEIATDIVKEAAITAVVGYTSGPTGLAAYGEYKFTNFVLSFPKIGIEIKKVIDNYENISKEEIIKACTTIVIEIGLSCIEKQGKKAIRTEFSKLGISKNVEKYVGDLPRKHHIVSNKHFKKFTNDFNDILKKYDGLKLDQKWNIVEVPYKYHYSKHPKQYHRFVLDEMDKIDNIAKGNKTKFLELFERDIKQKVLQNPNMLNKTGWPNE